MKNQILVFALQEEVDSRFQEFEKQHILVTGIGKLNTAICLSNFLSSSSVANIGAIVNLGTAGSITYPVGSLVEPVEFYERAVSFPSKKIYLEKHTDLPSAVCGTGDTLESLRESKPWDVVDMEAFVLARICSEHKIPFVCVKYITDVSEGNVYKDWKKNLIFAREKLYQYWNENLKNKSF